MFYVFLSSLLLGYACTNMSESKTTTSKKRKESAPAANYAQGRTVQSFSVRNDHVTDTSTFNLAPFLSNNNYRVQHESSGFLNNDRYEDRVLVLEADNEESNYLPRLTLVLLGSPKGFKLYMRSESIMQAENTVEGGKMFDTEDVKIEENKIVFDLYAIGPNGHISYEFAWINDHLQLHELIGYFMGAGSHTEYVYRPKSPIEGTLDETVINTMEDNMPSTTNTYRVKFKAAIHFETFDYSKCLEELVQQTGDTK
ncbi:hypothetical protein D3C80_328410 [compost metagenome]